MMAATSQAIGRDLHARRNASAGKLDTTLNGVLHWEEGSSVEVIPEASDRIATSVSRWKVH